MREGLLSLTASWSTAVGLAYFCGHAIADDGNVVGLGSHSCSTILDPESDVSGRTAIVVSKRPPSSWVHDFRAVMLDGGETH